MSDLFDSAWLKWGQAVLHAHDLYDELNILALRGEHFCKTRTEYDPKRHCLSLRVVSFAEPPPVLSLTLGDVVHNYRSCLDHIAWALVARGKTPPPILSRDDQAGVYFPLSLSKDNFTVALKGRFDRRGRRIARPKLPGVRRADIAIVRRYQPYTRGKRNLDLHVFPALDALSRQDKHREIWPILVIPQGGVVYVGKPQDCTVTRVPEGLPAYPLEVNAELHRVYIRKTGPNPYMEMEPHITVEPAVTPRLPVREWLAQTRSFMYQLLREFAEPPVGALEELGVLKIVDLP